MKFTFDNVYRNRDEFEDACKKAGACKDEFKRLVSANNYEDFMRVIYDNFRWINNNIREFYPKFDDAYSFYEGFACVKIGEKYGFMKTDGSYLTDMCFDDAYYFSEGFARVKIGEKWGYIKIDGSYLTDLCFDTAHSFSGGFALVRIGGKWGYIRTDGSFVPKKESEK
jgi:hypothetical protein